MAHPLCHALFTQLELGIKRYTYWAGGQKYFYRPDLLASPCGTGEPCVRRLRRGCDWLQRGGFSKPQHCITMSAKKKKKKKVRVPGRWVLHVPAGAGMDGTTAGAPLASVPLQTHLQLLIWELGVKKNPRHGAWILGEKRANRNNRVRSVQGRAAHGRGWGADTHVELPSPAWAPASTEPHVRVKRTQP